MEDIEQQLLELWGRSWVQFTETSPRGMRAGSIVSRLRIADIASFSIRILLSLTLIAGGCHKDRREEKGISD